MNDGDRILALEQKVEHLERMLAETTGLLRQQAENLQILTEAARMMGDHILKTTNQN